MQWHGRMRTGLARLSVALAFLLGFMAVSSASAQVLSIEIHKGRTIKLDRPAASVFIANPDIADIQLITPTMLYVFGRATGETSLLAVDERDRVMVDRPVSVNHNLSGLRRALRQALPGREIRVSTAQNGIVVGGIVASATEADRANRIARRFIGEAGEVINEVGIEGPQQVQLRVKIVEMNRAVAKQFGVNIEAIAQFSNFGFAYGAFDDILFGDDGSLLRSVDGANNTLINFGTDDVSVNALIDSLNENGLVRLLAEPNLTAISGETASFLAGGEFPIPVDTEDGIAIEFKEFGVQLNFTPTIVGEGRINLHVRPEVSATSDANSILTGSFSVPSLTARRAETTVELGSGQAFAIGGLLRIDDRYNIDKQPLLGDIPILGTLFRSSEFQRDESELVIIVTPYLVKPASSPDQLATPADGFTPPSDFELFVEGDYVGSPGEGLDSLLNREIEASGESSAAPSEPVGNFGFLLQ